MDDTKPHEVLWDLIKETRFCMLAHRHADGTLHSHPLTTQNKSLEPDMVLYFFVSKKTELGQRITADGSVNVSYADPQKDTFLVLHPKEAKAGTPLPLYVVLHSAGHDVNSCLACTTKVGNHDIYHAPQDFYALYLDCRANKGDWWWGGMHLKDPNLSIRNTGR